MFDFLCHTGRSFWIIARRRIITIPAYYLLFSVIIAGSVLFFPFALLMDLFTFQLKQLRRSAWGVFYSVWALLFLTVAMVSYPVRAAMRLASFLFPEGPIKEFLCFAFPMFMKGFHYMGIGHGFRFIYSVHQEVKCDAEIHRDRSYIIFINHTSFLDPVLPVEEILWRNKLKMRHVLWRGLILDPIIDLGVTMIDEAVVDPDNREEYAEDLRQMMRIVRRQKPGHAIAVYPEGGVENTAGEERKYKYLNNPRVAGMLHLLEEDEKSDVIFITHKGLEGGKYPMDIWRGVMTNKNIHLLMRVIPRRDVPDTIDELEVFLLNQWQRMDDWVGQVEA